MKLSFERRRTLPPKDEHAAMAKDAGKGHAVLGIADLTPVDREQLVACAGRGFDMAFTVEELYADDFRSAGGDRKVVGECTEVAFEWWDVIDEHGVPRYQVWLYHSDGALVFKAGTTTVLAQGIQSGSAWETEDGWSPVLSRALAAAHMRAAKTHPKSDLAEHDPIEAE